MWLSKRTVSVLSIYTLEIVFTLSISYLSVDQIRMFDHTNLFRRDPRSTELSFGPGFYLQYDSAMYNFYSEGAA